eukprot:jgi/Bigna1/143095/aug1.75_g17803
MFLNRSLGGGAIQSDPIRRRSQHFGRIFPSKAQTKGNEDRYGIDHLPHVIRIANVNIPVGKDPGKEDVGLSSSLEKEIRRKLSLPRSYEFPAKSLEIVRKSFDARQTKKDPCFSYIVDLFLTDNVLQINIVERGKAVGDRGKDIGALINRRILSKDSNLCYGEGGAGTWSDGKLATNIGRNTDYVRFVFERTMHCICFVTYYDDKLVEAGAPSRILVDGKPHLGTDRLVRILANFRQRLEESGNVRFYFGKRVEEFLVEDTAITGVVIEDVDSGIKGKLHSDKDKIIVIITICIPNNNKGAELEQKEFAAGFRVEHPQSLINEVQYKAFASMAGPKRTDKIPVSDYKLASKDPPVYSFCMCPGGQIVPTSIVEDELCINGMSFSRRQSQFANAALVTTIPITEFDGDGVLAGLEWQRNIERKAAIAGGGKLVSPAQVLTDFLDDKFDSKVKELPKSSYRMGIRHFDVKTLYPPQVIERIRKSLLSFEKKLPGFISDNAVLHGVETRTSSAVRIKRSPESCSVSPFIHTLFAAGEGAGYAGGIVSAAVDGVKNQIMAKFVGKKKPPFYAMIEYMMIR